VDRRSGARAATDGRATAGELERVVRSGGAPDPSVVIHRDVTQLPDEVLLDMLGQRMGNGPAVPRLRAIAEAGSSADAARNSEFLQSRCAAIHGQESHTPGRTFWKTTPSPQFGSESTSQRRSCEAPVGPEFRQTL